MMKLVRDKQDICRLIRTWQNEGQKVALVPTMGGIHDGHLALMRHAASMADKVVVSIYVNPTQFAAGEDFERYPRGLEADMTQIAALDKVHALFAPTSFYHRDHATSVVPAGAATGLEAEARPHFFGGVATVVLKLFMAMPADIAVFGEKDYQQLAVIRQMVRDLDIPIQIEGLATVRAENGLALSSRNQYLTPEHAQIAPLLYQRLKEAAADMQQGRPVSAVLEAATRKLHQDGFASVDYVTLVAPETLTPIDQLDGQLVGQARLLAAVWLGQTRLIDNIGVSIG
ncbi:MAG: pantoate--beta-alanine ligase [Candidatus Puniceispirillaceae bacterium]